MKTIAIDTFSVGDRVRYVRTWGEKSQELIGTIDRAWASHVVMLVVTANGNKVHPPAIGVFRRRADGHFRLNGDRSRTGPILEKLL